MDKKELEDLGLKEPDEWEICMSNRLCKYRFKNSIKSFFYSRPVWECGYHSTSGRTTWRWAKCTYSNCPFRDM